MVNFFKMANGEIALIIFDGLLQRLLNTTQVKYNGDGSRHTSYFAEANQRNTDLFPRNSPGCLKLGSMFQCLKLGSMQKCDAIFCSDIVSSLIIFGGLLQRLLNTKQVKYNGDGCRHTSYLAEANQRNAGIFSRNSPGSLKLRSLFG